MSETVSGNDVLQIANASWDERAQRYRGWQYLTAVGQAKRQIEKKRGGRKERKKEAEHTVSVLFNHSRNQSEDRLNRIALQASGTFGEGFNAGEDLSSFASEVAGLLNGPLNAGFGAFDPSMIIGLIMGIINAIKACKQVVPATT